MTPDFSEFSYGFAFTHEYVNHNPDLEAAPELPSLIREAEGGYDLNLGYQGHPKYFQFKLSSFMERSTAIHWRHHLRPHYRVRLTTRPRPNRLPGTDQHSQLKRLAETVDDVFYIAPRFFRKEDFDRLFLQSQVAHSSLWAPLRDLPYVSDNDVHYMTFTRGQSDPWWHSEAVELEGAFTAEEHYGTTQETVTIDENFFRGLRSKLRAGLGGSPLRATETLDLGYNDDIADMLRDTHRLLTAQYGLHMVILMEAGS